MPTRMLVIGLDGATFDLIKPWVEQGELPSLAKLMRTGTYSLLRSVYPVLSPSAWASFMTGVNPGKHGVVDFVERSKETYELRLIHRTDIKMPTLWRILSAQNKRVCVANVPMTYPAEPVNGIMITGLGTPLFKTFTYPPDLTDKLKRQGYKVDKEIFYHPAREDQYLKAVYDTCQSQLKVLKRLISDGSWDFFMYVFRDTDELAHFFWRHMDATHPRHNQGTSKTYGKTLLNFYKFVDKQIGELIKAAGKNVNVFIVSDHGFGPLHKDVFLNDWLAKSGFLVRKEVVSNRRLLANLGLTRSRISEILRGLGLHRVENLIKDILGNQIALLPRDERPEFASGIDWSRTLAYSFGYHGQIYINLMDREPSGIVTDDEYDAVRNQIITALKTLKDPSDGQLVVDQVFKREELFDGPYLNKMPDLVVVMRDFCYITRNGYELGDNQRNIFCDPFTHESGSHRLNGILIANGPSIKQGEDKVIESASITDLMPTLLCLLNCAVPKELDGQILSQILKKDWLRKNGITYLSEPVTSATDDKALVWSEEDEAELVERLKNLGYLS